MEQGKNILEVSQQLINREIQTQREAQQVEMKRKMITAALARTELTDEIETIKESIQDAVRAQSKYKKTLSKGNICYQFRSQSAKEIDNAFIGYMKVAINNLYLVLSAAWSCLTSIKNEYRVFTQFLGHVYNETHMARYPTPRALLSLTPKLHADELQELKNKISRPENQRVIHWIMETSSDNELSTILSSNLVIACALTEIEACLAEVDNCLRAIEPDPINIASMDYITSTREILIDNAKGFWGHTPDPKKMTDTTCYTKQRHEKLNKKMRSLKQGMIQSFVKCYVKMIIVSVAVKTPKPKHLTRRLKNQPTP